MHVFVMCTSRSNPRAVSEARAKMCMMGLTSMQAAWPTGGWVLKLFEHILARLCKTTTITTSFGVGVTRDCEDPTEVRSRHEHGVEVPQQHTTSNTSDPPSLPSAAVAGSTANPRTRATGEGEHPAKEIEPQRSLQGETTADAFVEDMSSQQPFTDLLPNLFILGEYEQGNALDQDLFFQWLELPGDYANIAAADFA